MQDQSILSRVGEDPVVWSGILFGPVLWFSTGLLGQDCFLRKVKSEELKKVIWTGRKEQTRDSGLLNIYDWCSFLVDRDRGNEDTDWFIVYRDKQRWRNRENRIWCIEATGRRETRTEEKSGEHKAANSVQLSGGHETGGGRHAGGNDASDCEWREPIKRETAR